MNKNSVCNRPYSRMVEETLLLIDKIIWICICFFLILLVGWNNIATINSTEHFYKKHFRFNI